MRKINRNLLPNICFDDSEQVFVYDGKRSPLEQALSSTKKSLYLIAAGGVGKTTSLRSFWLDFLNGKHDIACLYVDLKLLDTDEEKPILAYIKSKFKLFLQDDSQTPVLLLDGANEAYSGLREGNECTLVRECKQFISDGWRVVIASRSEQIGSHTEAGNNKREFSNVQYANFSELTDEQIASLTNIPIGVPLNKLLHNNMMLSIYMDLNSYGVEMPLEKLTAGKLLKLYIDICIQVRYIQNFKGVRKDEKDIFELLTKEENEDIYDGCKKFEEIYCSLLADPLTLTGIAKIDKKVKYSLQHLSIIEVVKDEKTDSYRYVWTSELYKEFFEALLLVELIKAQNFEDQNSVMRFIHLRDKMWKEASSQHYYEVLQFAGEIGEFSSSELSELYLKTRDKQYVDYENSCNCYHIISPEVTDIEWQLIVTLLDNHEIPLKDYGDGYKCVGPFALHNVIMILSVLLGYGMPNEVDTIDEYTFAYCKNLTSISFSDNIKEIGVGAFHECRNLKNVDFNPALDIIGDMAFLGCPKIEKLVFNSNLKSIGGGAFDCNIKTLELGPSLTAIGPSAFSGCTYLEEVQINSNVNTIESGTFQFCLSLKKIIFGPNIQIIDDTAFFHCESLEEFEVGPNIKRVGRGAFASCRELKSVKIISSNEGSTKLIQYYAFAGCSSLKTIYIPSNVILEFSIFQECDALTDVFCEDEQQPDTWHDNWLGDCKAQVHWGCKCSTC